MGPKGREGRGREGAFVRGGEVHGRRHTGREGLLPTGSAQAPEVPVAKPRKRPTGMHEVVATGSREP